MFGFDLDVFLNKYFTALMCSSLNAFLFIKWPKIKMRNTCVNLFKRSVILISAPETLSVSAWGSAYPRLWQWGDVCLSPWSWWVMKRFLSSEAVLCSSGRRSLWRLPTVSGMSCRLAGRRRTTPSLDRTMLTTTPVSLLFLSSSVSSLSGS